VHENTGAVLLCVVTATPSVDEELEAKQCALFAKPPAPNVSVVLELAPMLVMRPTVLDASLESVPWLALVGMFVPSTMMPVVDGPNRTCSPNVEMVDPLSIRWIRS
jgi:hypothetical protein